MPAKPEPNEAPDTDEIGDAVVAPEPSEAPAPNGPGAWVSVQAPWSAFDTKLEDVPLLGPTAVFVPQSSLALVLERARKNHVPLTIEETN